MIRHYEKLLHVFGVSFNCMLSDKLVMVDKLIFLLGKWAPSNMEHFPSTLEGFIDTTISVKVF